MGCARRIYPPKKRFPFHVGVVRLPGVVDEWNPSTSLALREEGQLAGPGMQIDVAMQRRSPGRLNALGGEHEYDSSKC